MSKDGPRSPIESPPSAVSPVKAAILDPAQEPQAGSSNAPRGLGAADINTLQTHNLYSIIFQPSHTWPGEEDTKAGWVT